MASGDFSQRPAVVSRDEIGLLTQSFNSMTQQLAEARNLYVALRYGPRSWGPQLNRSELSRLKFIVNPLKV